MSVLKIVVWVFFLCSSVAYAEFITAPLLKANWKIKKGTSYCQLKQNIPLYGDAEFMHQSGALLRFSIQENRYKPEIVKASLNIETAPWIHLSASSRDHLVTMDKAVDIKNYPRLSVYGEAAEAMLDALSQGMSPTFTYVRASLNHRLPETNVAISAVNFAKKYQQFVRCRKNFLPSGLKQILEKQLFFNPASKRLSADVQTQLKNIARYIKEVKGSKIVIVSETAFAGKRDKKWFSNRAKVIENKLKSLGVSKNKVTIKQGIHSAEASSKIIQLSVFGPDALSLYFFRKGSIRLSRAEKRRLDGMVRYAKAFQMNKRLVIGSHTDSKGKKRNNRKVSQKRGDEIKRYLVSKGLDERKVRVKSYGESRPVKSNRFPRGRARNRRAVLSFS